MTRRARPSKPAQRSAGKPPMPLACYLRLARRQRWVLSVSVVVMVVALAVADRAWVYRGGERGQYEGQVFAVARVVDGDTLDVAAPDRQRGRPQTRVRLWGVDTPEIAKPTTGAPAEPFADEAAAFTRRLCQGQSVRLQLESHQLRGRYGRLLAYVTLADGSMLNERLLAAGLARADERFVHRHQQRFALLEQQAQHDKVGMWSGDPPTRAPALAK